MLTVRSARRNGPSSERRVGYLLRMYPRFSQTFVVNEILELERQGLDIRILSLRKPTDGVFHESISRVAAKADYLPEAIWDKPGKNVALLTSRVRRTPRAFARSAQAVMAHAGANWIDLVQAVHVVRWAKRHRIKHLHVHFGTNEATVAMLARWLGGPTYSLTLHAFDIFRQNVDRRLLARKINASSFTVTVSQFNARYLRRCVPGVDAGKVRVNYNGIDLERFVDTGRPREGHLIFSVGRLIEKKGFRYLVDAVKSLRDEGLPVRCEIAGDGPEHRPLKDHIARLALAEHVKLLGPLAQADVCDRLQRATCFVLPCVQAADGNIDALPTVLLEAMACECPTISTSLSGIPEIIEDHVSGLLVKPGEAPPLAGAVRRILVNRSLAAQLARGGRRRAEERFDIRANARVMHDWLADSSGTERTNRQTPSEAIDLAKVTAA